MKKAAKEKLEDIFWFFKRLYPTILDIPNQIKWFFQRGSRGYAECDTWDLDNYLESWLPEAIDELRKRKISYPGYGKAKTFKQWQGILKRISDGIRAVRIAEEKIDFKAEIEARKKEKKALILMAEWFGHLWD